MPVCSVSSASFSISSILETNSFDHQSFPPSSARAPRALYRATGFHLFGPVAGAVCISYTRRTSQHGSTHSCLCGLSTGIPWVVLPPASLRCCWFAWPPLVCHCHRPISGGRTLFLVSLLFLFLLLFLPWLSELFSLWGTNARVCEGVASASSQHDYVIMVTALFVPVAVVVLSSRSLGSSA
jgi:hypothetical protein